MQVCNRTLTARANNITIYNEYSTAYSGAVLLHLGGCSDIIDLPDKNL